MPNAEQFMLTLSEHQTIQPVLVGGYMARALVLVVFVYGSFEEMKKGTSAIHGATFFFYQKLQGAWHCAILFFF
jgi:hypothetical protein